uniref:Uncharacterized protein n=1 Tax=Anguilla anguilla TaxID=7936 RepID=A0A0E9TH19_ANGAN
MVLNLNQLCIMYLLCETM